MQAFKSKAILIMTSFLSVVRVAALAQYAAPHSYITGDVLAESDIL